MKGIPVKPLHQNPETGSVPLQNLNRSPPAVAERKHATQIGIKFEFQLDNYSQSVIAFSQIGSPTGKVNGCATRQIKHDLSVPGLKFMDSFRPQCDFFICFHNDTVSYLFSRYFISVAYIILAH